ncbi:leucine-rich repeat-containing protein 36 [Spea bombifrons]|uniref:leucine-rich repeat-containing protein 36 n=1 Tax=Spea bombifrons TaxID=233779 RepID=UPI00234AF2BB|nr:leucine-rich repeat-containing protein 36 [Spea bombifrons]
MSSASQQLLCTTSPIIHSQQLCTTSPIILRQQLLCTTPPITLRQQLLRTTSPITLRQQLLRTTSPIILSQQLMRTTSPIIPSQLLRTTSPIIPSQLLRTTSPIIPSQQLLRTTSPITLSQLLHTTSPILEKIQTLSWIWTVETLSLQGTHKEKISSLGDAFRRFNILRCLDLSRNALHSLKGIEYLRTLRFLNLYYNDIAAAAELWRLRSLTQLQTLDLRLNPVTQREGDYRITVLQMLPTLQSLDERAVRDSERNTTAFPFQYRKYKAREPSQRENTAESEDLGEIGPNENLSDLQTRGPAEMRGTQQNVEPRDGFRGRSSPSRLTGPESRTYRKEPDELEDGTEYRPLPSPTRSSLRSPGKGSSLRAKEGVRVTFADSSLDTSPAKHQECDSNLIAAKKPIPGSTERPPALRNDHRTSTPLRKESGGSEERTRGEDCSLESGKDSPKSSYTTETSSQRLLRLSSDLYVATHLNDHPVPSEPSYAWRKGLGHITKTYTLPSKPSMANSYLYPAKAESRPESRENEAWERERDFGLGLQNTSKTQNGMKRSSSLNSLLPSAPERYARDNLLSDKGLAGRDSFAGSEEAPLADVIQQLLDLVDRYWNGSGSLIQNMKFMVPARELLSRLMAARSHYEDDRLLNDRSKANVFQSARGHAGEHDSTESLKQKLLKVMEENRVLNSKIFQLENSAIHKESSAPQLGSQGDLAQRYETLSAQLDSLQQQLKSHNLQDTMNLLHDSQRSLVSTNEYLLQQLNKLSRDPTSITAPHKQRSTADKLYYSDLNGLSSSPSAPTSGQYRKPERLSQCPL